MASGDWLSLFRELSCLCAHFWYLTECFDWHQAQRHQQLTSHESLPGFYFGGRPRISQGGVGGAGKDRLAAGDLRVAIGQVRTQQRVRLCGIDLLTIAGATIRENNATLPRGRWRAMGMDPAAWLQSKWLGLSKLALIAMLGFVIAKVVDNWPDNPHELGVIAEWNQTIARLGIEPVFPPEEDIFVGDVFAVITDDRRRESTTNGSLLFRAIKLHSEPMNELLAETYNSAPLFTDTAARPATDAQFWQQNPTTESVFAKGSTRKHLALAAFPGFTIKSDRQASGMFTSAMAALSGSSRNVDSIELRIPFVETYGIPSVKATYILEDLCKTKLETVCTDAALRKHLENIAGRLDLKSIDPETKKVTYQVDVQLFFVNRVYIARSIEQKRGTQSWKSLGGGYGTSPVSPNGTAPPPPPANGAPLPVPPPAVNGSAEPVSPQIPPYGKDAAAQVLQQSETESAVELKQVFQRPLVIGYRAVKMKFPTDLETQTTSATSPPASIDPPPSTSARSKP